MNVNLNAYEGVESLSRFSDQDFKRYCTVKLASVEKHIHFIKKHVIHSGYQGRVLEIGSGNWKLLFRLEQEGLLEKGVGYEVSQSRCRSAEKFKNYARIQLVSATGGLISKNSWFGVLKPRHFRGRLLSRSMMLRSFSSVRVRKSVPLGRYCRMSPLVFSLSPRSQEW